MAQMHQMQTQMQVPLKASQQVEAQLMISQIDSLFETFQAAIKYKNSGKATRDRLVAFNDAAVSLLDLFGAQCDEHRNEKERDILRTVYAHFWQKRKEALSSMKQQDVAVINNWLLYIENALTSDEKSKELQISQETVQFAEKNLLRGLRRAMNGILGAGHKVRKIGKDVEQNPAKYQQRNDSMREQTKAAYNAARNTSQCPTQKGMFNEFVGGQVQFAPPDSTGSKPVHHIPDFMDEDNKEEEHEHEYEQQETAPRRTAHDQARAPAQPQLQPPYHAVLWKLGKVPFATSFGRSVESVDCPVPCLVFRDLGEGKVAIQLPLPKNYISAECHVNELKVDKKEVAQFEAEYKHRKNLKDLGYHQ